MSDTATVPQGCEHLDGPYRRLLDEVQQLRNVATAARDMLDESTDDQRRFRMIELDDALREAGR